MSNRLRLSREMPTINGFPIHINELELPKSMMDGEKPSDYNNHHFWWTKARMGRLAMTQTLRDLDAYQAVTPRDVHQVIHDRYDPPTQLPHPTDMMDRIDEAYQTGELLRYGSASFPTYKMIDEVLYRTIQLEYNQINS